MHSSTGSIDADDYEHSYKQQGKDSFNEQSSKQERERMKELGQLFDRTSSIDRALLEELFHKEPSEYTQTVYRYASRIYHCLKADRVNPVLNAISTTRDDVQVKHSTLDVPRIDYASDKQKRRTLKLAFSVLRCT
jgi:transcriptional antiterminator